MEPTERSASPVPPPPEVPRAKILLIDDQRPNLLALEAILESLDQQLVSATSGRDALRHLLEDDFAVILLDVQMPDLDGYETAQLIRSRERSRFTPLMFITAYDRPDFSVIKAYATGAVDYLVKPVVPEILRAKVASFVEVFQKTEQVKRQAIELEAANRRLAAESAERKEALDELHRTAAELKRSNQELEQFAYVASHDLKEPLRKIRIYLQLLGQRYAEKLDASANQYIDYAVDAAERMQHLVNDLLTYARVGSRAKPPGVTDSAAVFDQILAQLEPAVRESGAVISRGSLPSVRADAAQLGQVFQNLLGNAMKFRREEAPPEIRVEAERNEENWLFSVRDNGIGIDPQYADRVFVIFERLHTRSEYPGTGMGLAICKKIIERHDGRIWLESEPGKGSTFKFTLPAASPDAP